MKLSLMKATDNKIHEGYEKTKTFRQRQGKKSFLRAAKKTNFIHEDTEEKTDW